MHSTVPIEYEHDQAYRVEVILGVEIAGISFQLWLISISMHVVSPVSVLFVCMFFACTRSLMLAGQHT